MTLLPSMPSYSDQSFSDVESSVSLLYNYPVIQSLKLYNDEHVGLGSKQTPQDFKLVIQ